VYSSISDKHENSREIRIEKEIKAEGEKKETAESLSPREKKTKSLIKKEKPNYL
jgi:hypothetical protein